MSSRKSKIENISTTKVKREKRSTQKYGAPKTGKYNTLYQNQIISPESDKKGLTSLVMNDEDTCFMKKIKECEKPRFLHESPILPCNSPSLSDMSDSDLIVLSEASPNSIKETSPEQSEIALNTHNVSEFPQQQNYTFSVKSSNSPKNCVKGHKKYISPSTSAKQAPIKFKSNVSVSAGDNILDIKENENLMLFESTFSEVNDLPEIEFNLETDFSELIQPEFLYSEVNSNSNINPPNFNINELQNSNEPIMNNNQDDSGYSPENCLSLLNSTLDAVVKPKEHFISNQLNIKSVIKPPDFSYESCSNSFILAIDLSVLKAANNYVKEKSTFFDLRNDLCEGEVIQSNSENVQSKISLVNCSTNDIHLDFYDTSVKGNTGGMEVLSNESHITTGNLEGGLDEQIYLDMNVGANVECTIESLEKFSDSDDIKLDCTSTVSRKVKRRKKTWYPKKQRCRRKNVSYNKNKTVPNASLNEEFCDTCDEESQDTVDFSTTLSDLEKTENAGVRQEIYNNFDNKTDNLISMPIGSSLAANGLQCDTKRKEAVDLHSSLSNTEKTENLKIMPEPCEQLNVKIASPVANPINASLNRGNHHSNTKRKRKRCIWDTKKRRCRKKKKLSETKNTEAFEPVMTEIFCDTCDESETDELTGDNYKDLQFSELGVKETYISSSDSCSQLNVYKTPVTPNEQISELNLNNDIVCDTLTYEVKNNFTGDSCEILRNSISEGIEILKTGSGECRNLVMSQIPVKENVEVVQQNTRNGKLEISKLEPNSDQQNLNDSSETHETSSFGIEKSSNHCASNVLNEVICNVDDEDQMERFVEEDNSKSLRISNIEENEKTEEILKTHPNPCSRLSFDIPGAFIRKDITVGEPISPEILDNIDSTKELISRENLRAAEVDKEILGTCPDDYQLNSVYNCHSPETSPCSSNNKLSDHHANDLSQESIVLMEDDLDFEPDPLDNTNAEILSDCSVDNTCTDVSIKAPVSSEAIVSESNEIFSENNNDELHSEPNLKICSDFSSMTSKNASFTLSQTPDSLSYLNFTKASEAISVKRNLPSEDDSDSDYEYNFKRSRRENNYSYKDDSINSSINWKENGFSVHADVVNSQNEITDFRTTISSPSKKFKIFSHFSNSPEEHQDILAFKTPDASQLCSAENDETFVNSSKSQVSLGNFYRLEDVVSKIKFLCSEKLVHDALQITQTYIGLSSNNGVNNYLVQELFSSLLSLIQSNTSSIDVSVATIFDQVLEIIENCNIDDKILLSKFIVECCSNRELYFHSIKVLYSCKNRNIPLKTSSLKVFGSFLKAEDIPLKVLLDYLHYIKSVCKKKMPKDLTHMALEKCKEYKYADVYQMCLLLHNINFKEVDPSNLQDFLLLCFKHRMWADIADIFIAWDSRHYLLECIYNALASATENIGDYFQKFADSLFHGHEGNLTSYQVYFIGQIGTALMLSTFSKCNLQCALEVLYTLHAHNINYFQQMFNTYKLYTRSKEVDASLMAFPYHVVFIAVDICLHFKRPKDAFKILQGFSWIVPDENLEASVKADVINNRFHRILKLIPFLNKEDSLSDGWEALKMLLLSAEQDFSLSSCGASLYIEPCGVVCRADFSLDDLKKYSADMLNVYNCYLTSLMNSGKITSLINLYKHSMGPCKEIITIVPAILRGLVVTFAEKGMVQEAKSVFMLGIIKNIYNIKKPESDTFPWRLCVKTNWSVLEIKLAVEWFLDGLLPLLTDKPGKTDYEKWFSLKIYFKISDAIISNVNCLKEIAIDPLNAIKRTREALQLLNPSLEFIEETAENILCITPDSLYNFWKCNCPNASPKVDAFPNQQSVKKKVSFGKECSISEGKSSVSSLDQKDCDFKLKESNNLIKRSPSLAKNLHLKSHFAKFDKESGSPENIVSVMIDEIRADISESPSTSNSPTGSYQNALSVATSSDNFKMPLVRPHESQVYSSNDAVKQSEVDTLSGHKFFQASTSFKLSDVNENDVKTSGALRNVDSPSQLMENSICKGLSPSHTPELLGNENNSKSIISPTSPLVVSQSSNSKVKEGALKTSPIDNSNHLNNISLSVKGINPQKRPSIRFVNNYPSSIEKSKTGQSSIEELSNFHVVKTSSKKRLSTGHKAFSNYQEINQIEPTVSPIVKFSKRPGKLESLITTPILKNLGSATKGSFAKLKNNVNTKTSNKNSSKKVKKFNKKKKFENLTISLTPNTSERTISQCVIQPSNSNMISPSKSFSNKEPNVPQTECLSTKKSSAFRNISSIDASASVQKNENVMVSLIRDNESNTVSKCISLPSNQNMLLPSQIFANEENITFQGDYDNNANSDLTSFVKNVSSVVDDTFQPSKTFKINNLKNAASNTISKYVAQTSYQSSHSTSQTFVDKKPAAKCVSFERSSHTSPEKNKTAGDVSLPQSKTGKISLIRNATSSTVSKCASHPSNLNKELISETVANEKLSISQKKTALSPNISHSSLSGKYASSKNVLPDKANKIHLVRNTVLRKSPIVNKCTSQLLNQNVNNKPSILHQVEYVSNSNVQEESFPVHASASVRNASSSDTSPSFHLPKADKKSFIRISALSGNSSCETEEHRKIIQFLEINVIKKYKNLSSAEQHQKAVTLAETFIKVNSISTVDKKAMKLLHEFAVSNV